MTAGYLDVSYIVINFCIVFGTTCVSVKPPKLIVLPVFGRHLGFLTHIDIP